MAAPLGIRKIDVGENSGRLMFGPEPNVDPATIIQLIQSQPHHYNLDGSDKIRFQFDMTDVKNRLVAVDKLLGSLSMRTD
jgi:transcription-repair coupling factor (superfamily II helicase)